MILCILLHMKGYSVNMLTDVKSLAHLLGHMGVGMACMHEDS